VEEGSLWLVVGLKLELAAADPKGADVRLGCGGEVRRRADGRRLDAQTLGSRPIIGGGIQLRRQARLRRDRRRHAVPPGVAGSLGARPRGTRPQEGARRGAGRRYGAGVARWCTTSRCGVDRLKQFHSAPVWTRITPKF
jgi:hypothetical protein